MAAGARPPAKFPDRSLVIKIEAIGGVWRRLYASGHSDPLAMEPRSAASATLQARDSA